MREDVIFAFLSLAEFTQPDTLWLHSFLANNIILPQFVVKFYLTYMLV